MPKTRRTLPNITRNSDDDSAIQPSWMSEYAKRLSKQSVQPYRPDNTLYDQIYSIINGNKPKYPSVDAAVKDMQERSGFSAYQDTLKSSSDNKDRLKDLAAHICRTAEEGEKKGKVKVFEMHPAIKNTVDNWIEEIHGNHPIPAVIARVREIHQGDVSDDAAWDEDNLMAYVGEKCKEVKQRYPDDTGLDTNLGHLPRFTEEEIDPSNRDALFCLNPATIK
jgi:hypothetical protein